MSATYPLAACFALCLASVVACTGTLESDGSSTAEKEDAPLAIEEASADGSAGTDARIEAATDAIDQDSTAPDDVSVDAPTGCGEFLSKTLFQCARDGRSRGKCVAGSAVEEACARGCLRQASPLDDVCMGTTDAWACTGSYGKVKAQDGDYFLTGFGCWIDAAGTEHTDPADNCLPTCFDKAKTTGLCKTTDDGKACEERIGWFTADGGRFGCLQHIRVTNPANGKSLIAVALDYGPACWVENKVSKAALDASGKVDEYLFGAQEGITDKALVHVVEVSNDTPLGPE